VLPNSLKGGGLDLKTQPARQAQGAQDPDRILAQADVRIADGPDHAGVEIGETPHVVDDVSLVDVVEEGVDREIPAQRVGLRRAEHVVRADQQVPFGSATLFSGEVGLNVATSMIFSLKKMWASRKRRPMIRQLRNSFLTSCGRPTCRYRSPWEFSAAADRGPLHPPHRRCGRTSSACG